MRPESVDASPTPRRIAVGLAERASDEPISKLIGIAVVPVSASASSAAPSGMVGRSPARASSGMPTPPSVMPKQPIMMATTADSMSDMCM